MRLRINHDIDRDTKQEMVNFDACLFTQADVDKAMKVLVVLKELLPATLPAAA